MMSNAKLTLNIDFLSETLWQAMYDFACHPKCHSELRKEIQEALEQRQQDKDDAAWLSRLPKLESFMKESQRMNAITLGLWALVLLVKYLGNR